MRNIANRFVTFGIWDRLPGLSCDRLTLRASRGGELLKLTPKEVGILELLLAHPGRVVTRDAILRQVWGMQGDPLTNIVDVYVGRLRRKLEAHGETVVETSRGFGYRLR